MLAEINEIRKKLLSWIIVFFILAIFFFFFNIKNGLPVFSTDSISLVLFQKIYSDLVPKNIKLLITNPLNILFIQIQISLFFAFILSLPILLYQFFSYFSQALHKREKRAIASAIIPSVLLFLAGCFFSYFLLIPFTLRLMNTYTTALDAAVYFEINEFVSFVLALVLSSGIAFMLPIFMRMFAVLEIVDAKFWIKNFKYAFIGILVFAAIITPDGTGVTMIILSGVLISLYFLGFFFSKNVYNEENRKEVI